MKRELFDNVVVRVGATGIAVDRKGFLSAVVAADIGEITGSPTETKLSVKVEHSDTADGTFTNVEDTMINPEHASREGILSVVTVESEAVLQINMDLLGCKRYIKVTPTITFTGGTSPSAASAAYALVLGDPIDSPV